MPHRTVVGLLWLFAILAIAAPAAAQRFPFDRTIDVSPGTALDVSTLDGAIDISVGTSTRVQVHGTVTVRVTAAIVTADAVQIAQRIAEHPPIESAPGVVRLRPPADARDRRAALVSYQVQVPPGMAVRVASESGAVSIRDVGGDLSVSTQSSAIQLRAIGGAATVKTGSGAVAVQGIARPLDVTTSSSGITVNDVRDSLRVRTQSGAVSAAFTGRGAVDVETSSSAITLERVGGAVIARTESGRVDLTGEPRGAWDVTTGSGAISAQMSGRPAVTVDLTSKSGSVRLKGLSVDGSVTKGRVAGSIGGGGAMVRLSSRSGSIDLAAAKDVRFE